MASTFYLDLYNGNDSSDGTSWANAWKTITGGPTAARIAGGDTIRISKTPDPVSIGNGKWTLNTQSTGGFPVTKNISTTANSSGLIKITTNSAHGYSTGDVVQIFGLNGTREANGAWVITYVDTTNFTLDNSAYINAYTSGGTTQLINSKAIVLETANTIVINRCEASWTSYTGTVLASNDNTKSGYYKLSFEAGTSANSKQVYSLTENGDFSSYQYISFYIQNSVAISDGNTFYITLCSDTAGATPVDTFVIPAIPSTARWLPLTIARTGGGNLGNNIQSIAINSGSTAPSANTIIRVASFIATKTNGINLQSLISKNGSAQGGTGAFYGIQSINGKVVLVDNDTNTLSNAGRGYYETSETCTTYIRETFKTALASSSSTAVSELQDSGTVGNLISYEFGYEVGTTNQNGETFLDGLNGNGYGIKESFKSFISLNHVNLTRYYQNIYLEFGNDIKIASCNNLSNSTSAQIYASYSNNNDITLGNIILGNSYGIYLGSAYNNKITFTNISGNVGRNLYINVGSYNLIYCGTLSNSGTYCIDFTDACFNTLFSPTTYSNSISVIANSVGVNFIRNATINETNAVGAYTIGTKTELWSIKEDGTEGNNWGYFYGATANWQTTTKYGTQPGAWKVAITSSDRKSNYKVPLKLAEVVCEAGKLVTFKAWVKKDHATNVAAQIRVDTDTVNGITGTTTSKADDTNWEELTMTFTPTYACVTEIYGDSWYSAGTSNVYYGSISIQQST